MGSYSAFAEIAPELFVEEPWLLSAASVHQAIPQSFHFAPHRCTPTEHFQRLATFEVMSRKAQMPKWPAARVAHSLHANIDGKTGACGAFSAPEMATNNLAFRVKYRVFKRKSYLRVHFDLSFAKGAVPVRPGCTAYPAFRGVGRPGRRRHEPQLRPEREPPQPALSGPPGPERTGRGVIAGSFRRSGVI